MNFDLQMKGSQYPFGVLEIGERDPKKMMIKKRVHYKNSAQCNKLKEKIDKLKSISHRNTINLRSTEDTGEGWIDLFYPYVPTSLQDYFMENQHQAVKVLHKQCIELAIYLAKHYILTSFNSSRCGVVDVDGKVVLKYFLPLNQIIITDNINMLQRSVQLFNVQSINFLDMLSHSALDASSEMSSQRTFKNRLKLNPQVGGKGKRRDSQPAGFMKNHIRRMSNNPSSHLLQIRKLSNLSKELSEISQSYKLRNKHESIRTTTGSDVYFKSTIAAGVLAENLKEIKQIKVETDKLRVDQLLKRSRSAIDNFSRIKTQLKDHKRILDLLHIIKNGV